MAEAPSALNGTPNPEDQQKLIELYRKSGAKTKSDYLRGRLLNEPFKVITEDTTAEPYLRELDNIVTLTRKIGVLYNEAVKTLSSYHTVATVERMIRKIKIYSEELLKLQIQAIQLTMFFETKAATNVITLSTIACCSLAVRRR